MCHDIGGAPYIGHKIMRILHYSSLGHNILKIILKFYRHLVEFGKWKQYKNVVLGNKTHFNMF